MENQSIIYYAIFKKYPEIKSTDFELIFKDDVLSFTYWNSDFGVEPSFESLMVYELDVLKDEKNKQMKEIFENSEFIGCDTSLGFRVDCKRSDVDNMDKLINVYTAFQTDLLEYRDFYNVFHPISLAQLTTMYYEVIFYGMNMYQWKWNKEAEIYACTTKQELENVSLTVTL